MRLCYQVATPDVAIADSVTAYQGPLPHVHPLWGLYS